MRFKTINGALLKKMIISGANELNKNRSEVDALNVFPVPDGDTGTNMSLTVLAAAREVEKSSSLNVSEIAKMASNGSLRGARGNSGVILSQLFRGFAKGLEGIEEANIKDISKAFAKAVETAYKAVMKPKEGTILTVARAIAESAEKLSADTEDIEVFMQTVIADAHEMLLKTKYMLDVLRKADLIDAGGRGLIYILEGAFNNLYNEANVTVEDFSAATSTHHEFAGFEETEITFGYCTEFFINVKDIPESKLNELKKFCLKMGDSLVLVNDEDIVKIHVHTDHPGLVLEKALSYGSLSNLKIDNMREQHTSKINFAHDISANSKDEGSFQTPEKYAFISVSMGSGISEIFKNLGANEVIEGGQTMNPSTEDFLTAIDNINAENIFVLPNNKNIILAAEQATELLKDKNVVVLKTVSVPQGISAMVAFNAESDLNSNIEAMQEAMSLVNTAMVTFAIRDTVFGEKIISEGDIIGISNDDICTVSKSVEECTKELIDCTINENHEIISIYYGADVSGEDANVIAEYISEKYPGSEVEVYNGGQPLYYYIISIE
ncbi:MAG: DAK2 domain-containing protein [Lachnospiraceae bacterium]|nr:DAK2 domain-containing protein [Lachnospiraceae bacterium]